jgi:stress response protein YsnF
MNSRYFYTVKWTQPYATYNQRPYLRSIQEQLEKLIEEQLSVNTDYSDAQQVIDRIKSL